MIGLRIDKIDLRWSNNGDFILNKGDLEDTKDKPGEGFLQEVRSRISTIVGSWKTNTDIGSNIDSFEGRPNTKGTGALLKRDLAYALVKDGFLAESDFDIIPVPLSENRILIRIVFRGILTEQAIDSTIILNIIYDLTGKGPFIIK